MSDISAKVLRVLTMEGQAILDSASRLKSKEGSATLEKALSTLKQALDHGGKIVVTGVGKSGKVGQKIAATLCSTGSLAVFLHPTEGLHGDLGVLGPHDAVLALSYTGNTEELLQLMPSIKRVGAKVIGIGGNARSRLSEQSDVWIDAAVEQEACPHNLAPTTSTTLALAIGDALAITLMEMRGFDQESFAQNHPGGSIGRKLNLRVADVMHSGDAVATVALDAPMDTVVLALTQKPLGAALVVAGSQLAGIITEGDIRRALKHRERFFALKASDVMTAKPVTVTSETLAKGALELMENRPSQIYVLPVVDDRGQWKGLLRLHDLARLF